MTIIFSTARLDFRVWESSCAHEFVELCQQPGLAEFGSTTYDRPTLTTAHDFAQQQNLDFKLNGLGKFAVVRREDDRIIGISGIFKMDPPFQNECEINYRFVSSARGQGYALEAAKAILQYGFKTLGLSRIHACVSPANAPSKRLLKKLGLQQIDFLNDEEIWVIRVAT